jgi:hypothetical protein
MRTLTDRERFGCSALIEALATEGRSREVMLAMGAQSVAYATPSLKDQARAIFVGQMTSRAQVKDLADLTDYGRELVPTLASVPSRRSFYTDRWEGGPVACMTGIEGSLPSASPQLRGHLGIGGASFGAK